MLYMQCTKIANQLFCRNLMGSLFKTKVGWIYYFNQGHSCILTSAKSLIFVIVCKKNKTKHNKQTTKHDTHYPVIQTVLQKVFSNLVFFFPCLLIPVQFHWCIITILLICANRALKYSFRGWRLLELGNLNNAYRFTAVSVIHLHITLEEKKKK